MTVGKNDTYLHVGKIFPNGFKRWRHIRIRRNQNYLPDPLLIWKLFLFGGKPIHPYRNIYIRLFFFQQPDICLMST